jgi:serine/threonine protein phosphatase 1
MTDSLTTPVRYLTTNQHGRDFVVGDLHGSWSLLQVALDQVEFDRSRDRLLSVGDIVDRGEESFKLIELLQTDWFYACLGNHESVLLEYQRQGEADLAQHWRQFGGSWFFDLLPAQRAFAAELIERHCSYALQVEMAQGKAGVVHADVPMGVSWPAFCANVGRKQDWQRQCLWSRARVQGERTDGIPGIELVVTGHQIVQHALQVANVWLIDTGAYRVSGGRGQLTLLELPGTLHVVS